MLILFFNSKGITHHEYVSEGQTVNATFYVQNLGHLCKRIARIRPEMGEIGSSFFSMIMFTLQSGTVESHFIFARFKPRLFCFPKIKIGAKR